MLHDGNVLVASMCGKVRHAIAAVEAGCDFVIAQGTEAGGHTGTVATFPLVPQIVDEVGDRVPVSRRAASSTGAGSRPRSRSAPTACGSAPASSRRPKRAPSPGYKEALIRTPEDGTVISKGFTGKTLRAVRNEWTQYIEEHPEELRPFPEQMMRAVKAQALHLGGDETADVDPDKECYPAGQGVGAIDALVPAGDLVRQIVAEAERALHKASSYA